MSVPAEVTLEAVREELVLAHRYATSLGCKMDDSELSAGSLRFYVTFLNQDGVPFFAEFECTDYPMYPPTVEFVSQDHTRRAARELYPRGFHNAPCVCARYNRKAYKQHGGPHADWRLVDWRLPTSGGTAVDSITMMLSDLQSKISRSTGRLG